MRSIVILILFLAACGPSKEEQEARDNSIRVAAEVATKKRFEEISLLKDSISNKESRIEGSTNLLMIRKADLEASRDKLNVIKEFQFLRTAGEREQQIRAQVIVIETLENEVIAIAHQIDRDKASVTIFKKRLASLQ